LTGASAPPETAPGSVDAQTSRDREGSFSCDGSGPTGSDEMSQFQVYDTTLRDGAQQEGLTLSVAD
jgi:hypothetical protein